MIISLHIRKSAGSSFRKELEKFYGDKLLLDYGDRITCRHLGSRYKRLKSKVKMLQNAKSIIENKSIIHGHFFAGKYDSLNTPLEYVTFLRDPVERVLSNYYYLKREPLRKHSDSIVIHKHNYTLKEYILHKDAQNSQATFLNNKALSSFKFVGIVEEYDNSIRLFNKIFNTTLASSTRENINPNVGKNYDVDEQTIALIEKHNKKDMQLYKEAKEIFYKMLKEYDIS